MADAWERIAAWCSEHAPETAATIRAPAPTEVAHWAERSTAQPWPDALAVFYAWCDGTERTPAGYLWPGFRPLPLVEMVETWRMSMRAWFPNTAPPPDTAEQDLDRAFVEQLNELYSTDEEMLELGRRPAGTAIARFHPALVPIAEDQSGSLLVCDLRGRIREGYGAVAVFDRDDGYTQDAPWRSLRTLASATAQALSTSRAVTGTRYHPITLGGRLTWSRTAPDPLDDADGATTELPDPTAGWTPLPGTDLEAQATPTATGTRLRYRRTTADRSAR